MKSVEVRFNSEKDEGVVAFDFDLLPGIRKFKAVILARFQRVLMGIPEVKGVVVCRPYK